jgi:hypothetical protein
MNLQEQAIEEAIQELTRRGYRNVTELVKPFYEEGDFDYLCVLQKPHGEPAYCQLPETLFVILEAARTNNETSEMRTAPEPSSAIAWTLVGNFAIDDQLS